MSTSARIGGGLGRWCRCLSAVPATAVTKTARRALASSSPPNLKSLGEVEWRGKRRWPSHLPPSSFPFPLSPAFPSSLSFSPAPSPQSFRSRPPSLLRLFSTSSPTPSPRSSPSVAPRPPHPPPSLTSLGSSTSPASPPLFICPACFMHFPSPAALEEHFHRHTRARPHPCPHCPPDPPRAFSSRSSLLQHLRVQHPTDAFVGSLPSHVCPTCSRRCSSVTQLRIHERSHSRERPYPCHLCPLAFARKSELVRHVALRHEKVRNWACPHCLHTFSSRYSVTRHIGRRHKHIEIAQRGSTSPTTTHLTPLTHHSSTSRSSTSRKGSRAKGFKVGAAGPAIPPSDAGAGPGNAQM